MLKLEAVEVMLTAPLAAPLVVGEKSTVKDVLWPAFNVKGKASPLTLNPLPLAVTAEIVRLDPPELVRVSVIVLGVAHRNTAETEAGRVRRELTWDDSCARQRQGNRRGAGKDGTLVPTLM
jgi:hypothetical protein